MPTLSCVNIMRYLEIYIPSACLMIHASIAPRHILLICILGLLFAHCASLLGARATNLLAPTVPAAMPFFFVEISSPLLILLSDPNHRSRLWHVSQEMRAET